MVGAATLTIVASRRFIRMAASTAAIPDHCAVALRGALSGAVSECVAECLSGRVAACVAECVDVSLASAFAVVSMPQR
jgi:hypothetical protein